MPFNGKQQAAELSLQAAERASDSATDGVIEVSPGDPEQLYDLNKVGLQGRVAAIRAFMASFRGDIPGIIQFSHQALEYLPEEDSTWRCSVAIASGDAHGFSGDMVAASRAFSEAVTASQSAGNIYLFLIANLKLAVNQSHRGRLQRAIEICRQLLEVVNESGLSQTAMAGWLFAVWGEVLCEWNDLDEAVQYVKKGAELSEQGHDVAVLGWSHLCLVRVLFARRDMAGAEKTIQKLEKIARESDVPPWITYPIAGWQARIWLTQGKLDAASQWAQERGLNVGEHIVFARILIAQGRLDEATGLLERLLKKAEAGGRTTRAIEILMLQALAFQAQGDTDEAMNALERALTLAEPGGYIRIFVDEGLPMAVLLTEMNASREGGTLHVKEYIRKLLAAFGKEENIHAERSSFIHSLAEPLSERELEALRLLAAGLSNREIADEMVVAVGTVKAHTSSIYRKLDVRNRAQAILRAKELSLVYCWIYLLGYSIR